MSFGKKSFLIISMGTLIEYYDYALLAIFLPIMAPVFFPGVSHYHALVKGYWVLLVAMIARPIGGLCFGYIGDWFGRRLALMFSIAGIALTTLAMGLLPGYSVLGAWAAVLLTVFKSIQLFCFGGEYSGAGIFVVEHAKQIREAFKGSLLTAMTLVGGLLAALMGVILTHLGKPETVWRYAYIIGAVIGFVAIVCRHSLKESPEFVPAKKHIHTLSALAKQHRPQMIASFFVGGFATLSFTTVLTFINPILMTTGYFDSHSLMWLQMLITLVAIVALLVAGHIADKTSPLQMMTYAALALAILACPLMYLVGLKWLPLLVFAEIGLIICNECLLGPSNAFLKNCFPVQYRYRAVSLLYCAGMAFVGGLTPIIENALYQFFNAFAAAGLWIVFISICTFVSLQNVHAVRVSKNPPRLAKELS